MSLRFIYGRAGSGKTRYCLEEIKERMETGATHPLLMLVPEQYSFQAERDLIRVLQRGGSLQTQVLSFRRMAYRIFNQAGGITCPHIHPAGKCMILYRILDQMQDDFRVFARATELPGFVHILSALISEFKRYRVTPEGLAEVQKNFPEDDPFKEKLRELQVIYAVFEEILADTYQDGDDDLTLAAEKLDLIDLYTGAEIWVDGFTGFTPQEYQVLGKLLHRAKRVHVSLCTGSLEEQERSLGTDVFSSVKQVYKKLANIARDGNIPLEAPVLLEHKPLYRFTGSPELAHLEENLHAYPGRVYPHATGDIVIFSSANIFTEIEGAAQDIIRLCRDQGMRYRDIALVVRNLSDYEQLIQAVFDEYEIPYFIDKKKDITNHPLVRLILSMLEIFIDNWSYEDVFSYLKTGLTDVDRESVDLLENYVLACGIRGRRWTNGQDWQMSTAFLPEERASEEDKKRLEKINRIRVQLTTPLLEFRKKTKGRKNPREICGALFDFLCQIGVPERINAYVDGFRKNGELSLAHEYSQVWNIVMAVLDQVVEVMGEETLSLERFSHILKVGLEEYQVGLVPAALDQVLVGSVERSKSHEIQALYILGANDGVFPAVGAEEGILLDRERVSLNQAGLELASDTRTKAFDEQFLVYRALTIPRKYLRISWPIANQDGQSLRPSPVIARLKKIFPKIQETSDIMSQSASSPAGKDLDWDLICGRPAAFQKMLSALRQKADGKEISSLWSEVYQWFKGQEEWKSKCLSLREGFLYRNLAEPVSKEKIPLLYGDPVYSSVSRMEKYSSCPFAYYLQYGLKAGERKIYRLSPPDVGTFMHEVIERFSRLVGEEGYSWRNIEQEWCAGKVSSIVDEMLEKMQGAGLAGSKRYQALAVRLKRVMTRAVWLIAQHIRRSSFEPIGYEVDFGDGGKFPPIIIELDSGETIKLTGRIDRVDALRTEEGTYLRIIDYKSGSKDFKLADLYYGLEIQLITYLNAICNLGEGNQGEVSSGRPDERELAKKETQPGQRLENQEKPEPTFPGGMLYFRLDDPIIRRKGKVSEEEIEQAIMKQLRMRGLLLADVRLIKAMDHTIEGDSLIIPARMNKGDVLGRSSSVASLDQFKILRKHVRHLLKRLGQEMLQGDVSIRPYQKKDRTSCTYCSFSPVCQFDPGRKENRFRVLHPKKDDEIWSLMNGGEE